MTTTAFGLTIAVSGPAESKTIYRDKVHRSCWVAASIALGRFGTTLI